MPVKANFVALSFYRTISHCLLQGTGLFGAATSAPPLSSPQLSAPAIQKTIRYWNKKRYFLNLKLVI